MKSYLKIEYASEKSKGLFLSFGYALLQLSNGSISMKHSKERQKSRNIPAFYIHDNIIKALTTTNCPNDILDYDFKHGCRQSLLMTEHAFKRGCTVQLALSIHLSSCHLITHSLRKNLFFF